MATAKEVVEVLELFFQARLKGDMIDAKLAKQIFAAVDAEILRAAAIKHIQTSKFMPTVSELNPLIEEAQVRLQWQMAQMEEIPHLTDEDIFELALWQSAQREPQCEKCKGGGYVTNDENEMSMKEFRHHYGRLPEKEEIKPCDAACIGGHKLPPAYVMASLRGEIFPQSTTAKQRQQ